MRRFVAALFAASLLGCGAILGVDFSNARLGDDASVATDAGPAEAGVTPFTIANILTSGDELTSIWGVDDDTLFAVGTRGVRVERVGGEWVRSAVHPGRDYAQVWGAGPNDVYAVGLITGSGKGFVEHFDGEQWWDEYTASTPIVGIWSDGTAVIAIGRSGVIYGKAAKNGTWEQVSHVDPSTPGTYVAVTGNVRPTLTVVAEKRVYHTSNMGDWQWLEPQSDTTLRFASAWGTPGSTIPDVFFGTNYLGVVWMVAPRKLPPGAYDASLLEPDGSLDDLTLATLIKDESDPNADGLRIHGIAGIGTKRYFVGDRGRVYALDILDRNIRTIPSPTSDPLRAAWASKTTLWVVGSRELVLRAPLP